LANEDGALKGLKEVVEKGILKVIGHGRATWRWVGDSGNYEVEPFCDQERNPIEISIC